MTALDYMERQAQKHRLNFDREFAREVPEEMLENIRKKIGYYEAAVEALREVAEDTKVLTNADHYRSASVEELAALLLDGCRGSKCEDQPQNEYGSVNCFQCRLEWLKQPYKGGNHEKSNCS